MRILTACEYSGIVRNAFAERGHDAWSCDLIPTELPGNHIQDDVLKHLDEGWDMMIAFPPCDDLSAAGAQYWPEKIKNGKMQKSIDFFMKLYNADIPKICIENPVGIMNTIFRKPDQIIHPHMFGDPYYKRTCLWLKNLPILLPVRVMQPVAYWVSSSFSTKSNLKALYTDKKKRSKFFPGIAEAMAIQWGGL